MVALLFFGDYPLDKVALIHYHRKQNEQFDELIDFLGDKYIAMLAGYFDASGTHDGSKVTTMAGFISDPKRLKLLNRYWSKRLREDGIDCFHSADCEARTRQFKGWKQDRIDSLRLDLIAIIHKHTRKPPLASIVYIPYFEEAKRDFPQLNTTPEKYSAERCVISISDWIEKYERRKHGIIFFDRSEVMTKLVNVFCGKHNFGWKCAYAISKETPALQAADLLAYELYRLFVGQTQEAPDPIRKELQALLPNRELRHVVESVKTIRGHLKDLATYGL